MKLSYMGVCFLLFFPLLMVAIVFGLFLGYEGVFFIAFCARKIYSFLQGKGSYDGVCLYLAAGYSYRSLGWLHRLDLGDFHGFSTMTSEKLLRCTNLDT